MKLDEIRARRRARRTWGFGGRMPLRSTIILMLGAVALVVAFYLMSHEGCRPAESSGAVDQPTRRCDTKPG